MLRIPLKELCNTETELLQMPLAIFMDMAFTNLVGPVSMKRTSKGSLPNMRTRKRLPVFRRAHTRLLQARMSEQEDDRNDSKDEGEPMDWDSSWSSYSQKHKKDIFKLPDVEPIPERTDPVDKQVEQLTSFWGNETGFLVAICVIAAIGGFYYYVYATGGISH